MVRLIWFKTSSPLKFKREDSEGLILLKVKRTDGKTDHFGETGSVETLGTARNSKEYTV